MTQRKSSHRRVARPQTAAPEAEAIVDGTVYLHRSVAKIQPEKIEIRPALSAAIAPLIGVLIGGGAFTLVLLGALGANFPIWLMALSLMVAVLLLPLSGMGLVYSLVGASVVIDARKNSITWQQGLLGMGVGTRELVPFEKIASISVVEVARRDASSEEVPEEAVAQWDLVLVKTSGRELTIATVSAMQGMRDEGLDRVTAVARAVSRVTGVAVGSR